MSVCCSKARSVDILVPAYLGYNDSKKPSVVGVNMELTLCRSLSVLTAMLPGEPVLAGTRISQLWILLELRMMEVVVTTGVT